MALPRIIPFASIAHLNGTTDVFCVLLLWFAATANCSSSCTEERLPLGGILEIPLRRDRVPLVFVFGDSTASFGEHIWVSEFFPSACSSCKEKLVPLSGVTTASYGNQIRESKFVLSALSSLKEKPVRFLDSFIALYENDIWESEFLPSASPSCKEELVRIVSDSTSSHGENIWESESFPSASSLCKEELLIVGASASWRREGVISTRLIVLSFFCILGFLYTNLCKDGHECRYDIELQAEEHSRSSLQPLLCPASLRDITLCNILLDSDNQKGTLHHGCDHNHVRKNFTRLPKYLSIQDRLVLAMLLARDKFALLSACTLLPKSIIDVSRRLCSSVLPNWRKADWNSACSMSESRNKEGTVSEFNTRQSTSKRNKFTEYESHLRFSYADLIRTTQTLHDCCKGSAFGTVFRADSAHKRPCSVGYRVTRRGPKYLSMFSEQLACIKSILVPKNIFHMARRLCSSALPSGCKTDWNSACNVYKSTTVGTVTQFNTRKSTSKRSELTENESHLSGTDLSRAEDGINEAKDKTVADWVAATGAPHHATGNRDLLSNIVIEHDDQFVHAVDGVPRKVLARGAVITDAVVLPDVWYVPGLTENLVSISQLAELDHSIGFGCGECCIWSTRDAKIVGKGHLQNGGHYVLDFLKVPLAI